jgi:thiol-disulfide isomerase/thioredoxin
MTAVLLLLCVASPLENVPATASEAQATLDKLLAELSEKEQVLIKQGKNTVEDSRPLYKEYLGKLEAHARRYPDDPSAVEALIRIVQVGEDLRDHRDLAEPALARLRKDYLHTPLVVTSLRNLAFARSGVMLEIAREVREKHPSKRIRALAWRMVLNSRVYTLSVFRNANPPTPTFREELEKEAAEAREQLNSPELRGAIPDLSPGAKAPPTQAVDLEGNKVELASLQGKVVVLDFWHTHCGPCKRMIPQSNALVKEMQGRPFVHISVSVDTVREDVVQFRKKTEMLGEAWWAGRGSTATQDWDVEMYPTIYIIDHEGIIRHHQIGSEPKTDTIAEQVRDLVNKAEKMR